MGCSSRLTGTWSLMTVAALGQSVHPAEVYLSANRTCEMGLQQATGKPYESFIFMLEELTRPEVDDLAHTHGRPRRGRSDSYQGEKYGQDR